MFRFMIGAVVFATTMLAAIVPSPATVTAQSRSATWPAVGQIVSVQNTSSNVDLRITVTTVLDNPSDAQSKRRGYRNLLVEILVENLSSESYEIAPWHFLLFDDLGATAPFSGVLFSSPAAEKYPPFEGGEVQRNERMKGWLDFELANEARPAHVTFSNYDLPPYFTVVAWIDPIELDPEGAQPIMSRSGATIGTLRIDAIITNFETTDAGIDPRRGWSTLAVAVTMTNLSQDNWPFRDEDFWILDDTGEFYARTFYDRSMESFQAFPELGFRAKPEQIVRGVLLFEIPDDVQLERVIYVPNGDQFFVVGWDDPDLALTGAEAAESMDIDSRTSTDESCAGVQEWAEHARDVMETAALLVEDLSDPEADIDAASLHTAAFQIRLMADEQRREPVPPEAAEAQEAILTFMDTVASELKAAANRVDAGESVATALQMLNSPASPITGAVTVAAGEVVSLSNDCDLGSF